MTPSNILLLLLPPIFYIALVSAGAVARAIPLTSFWLGTFSAVLPWVFLLVVILVSVSFLPENRKQAGTMVAMFPAFGAIAAFAISPIMGLFISGGAPIRSRLLYIGGVSSVAAILMGAFLLWGIFSE